MTLYQVSRGIYRALANDILPDRFGGGAANNHEAVLRACEATVERMVRDRDEFPRPARSLFNDIRIHFPMTAQGRVWSVVECHVACAQGYIDRLPRAGYDEAGNPVECRATTRRGSACQRMPLAHNGYCPSHQHLAETEHVPAALAA